MSADLQPTAQQVAESRETVANRDSDAQFYRPAARPNWTRRNDMNLVSKAKKALERVDCESKPVDASITQAERLSRMYDGSRETSRRIERLAEALAVRRERPARGVGVEYFFADGSILDAEGFAREATK